MLDVVYLAFIPDLFGEANERFYTLDAGNFSQIDVHDIQKIKKAVVCIHSSSLLDQLRSNKAELPRQIIDLEGVRRLIVGLPSKESANQHWNTWAVLRRQSQYNQSVSIFKSLSRSQKKIEEVDDLDGVCLSFLQALEAAWVETGELLEYENESDRFGKVELQANSIYCQRQLLGLQIDLNELSLQYEILKQEKYRSYINVAEALNVSPSGFNFRNIAEHLKKSELESLANDDDAARLEQNLKLASINSPLAADIISLIHSDRDLKTLSRLSSVDGKCYPTFINFGTVTGRTMVKDPYLQGLRKAYRSVIIPDDGCELVYLDYDQFEPGILSALSGDKVLQSMYEEGDIYTELSHVIFDDSIHRKEAKQMFISFLYGMSEQRIIDVLFTGKAEHQVEKEALVKKVQAFFSSFSVALEYRKEMQSQLLSNGKLETLLGGHRKRSRKGNLSAKEMRWALSQRIQGTASLIFKEALIKIAGELGADTIMLPMHDAFLLQLESYKLEENTQLALSLMKSAMHERCPSINPKVSLEPFG